MKIFMKIFLVFTVCLSILNALTDLGTHGKTNSIEGKGFHDEIKERAQLVDEKELQEKAEKSAKASFNLGKNLPLCQKTQRREFAPTITFKDGLKVPITEEVIFKKGEKVNVIEKMNIFFNYHMLFLDASDEIQTALAQSLKNQAMIMFVNGDISDYVLKGENIYVARKDVEVKSFDIQCVPSIVTQSKNKFIITEYNTEDLKESNQ